MSVPEKLFDSGVLDAIDTTILLIVREQMQENKPPVGILVWNHATCSYVLRASQITIKNMLAV